MNDLEFHNPQAECPDEEERPKECGYCGDYLTRGGEWQDMGYCDAECAGLHAVEQLDGMAQASPKIARQARQSICTLARVARTMLGYTS